MVLFIIYYLNCLVDLPLHLGQEPGRGSVGGGEPLEEDGVDAEPGGGVGGLSQQASRQAGVQTGNTFLHGVLTRTKSTKLKTSEEEDDVAKDIPVVNWFLEN